MFWQKGKEKEKKSCRKETTSCNVAVLGDRGKRNKRKNTQ
jgi:hypothetical protein